MYSAVLLFGFLQAALAAPRPQDFDAPSGSPPTCGDPKSIPAGTSVLGIVTGPVQTNFSAPVIVSASSPKGGSVTVTDSVTHSFSIEIGVNYSPPEIEGLQFTSGISWTDASSTANGNTVDCTSCNCSATFSAKMGTINGASYIDMNGNGQYDKGTDVGPDDDPSCAAKSWQGTAPFKLGSGGGMDGNFGLCCIDPNEAKQSNQAFCGNFQTDETNGSKK